MTDARTDCPHSSTNNLKDIIEWLQMGDIIVLRANGCPTKVYHRCSETCSLDDIRVIVVDVSGHASLLEEDEWPWYIENSGETHLCSCDLGKDIWKKEHGVPHLYVFALGYGM